MKKIHIFIFTLLVAIAFVPMVTFAESNSLICKPTADPGKNVSTCINNIYVFSIGLAGFVAVLTLVLAGYYYMTGVEKNVAAAKDMIKSVIIGLLILFGTYAILNTIDPELTSIKSILLDKVDCSGTKCTLPTGGQIKIGDETESDGTGVTIAPCKECIDITTKGIAVKNGKMVNKGLADKLVVLQSKFQGWRVTEAHPPTSAHSSPCHADGTCVDIALMTNKTADTVSSFCAWAKEAGLSIVNEYESIYSKQGTACPAFKPSSKSTGNHLHVR